MIAAQNGVLELLLANHPLDCPICDKGGECPLQDNTFKFGLGVSRFTEEKRQKDKAFVLSDRIVLDRERCIMCYRCTRFQAEIAGDEALAAVDRGGYSEIGVLEGETFDSPFSGNTIELCPVGALTSRQYRFKARPWDLQRTPSICAGCALGCNIELHARDGQILRMWGRDNPAVNDGWLCDHDRFDTLPAAARPAARPGRWCARAARSSRRPGTAAYARAAELLKGGSAGVLASPSLDQRGDLAPGRRAPREPARAPASGSRRTRSRRGPSPARSPICRRARRSSWSASIRGPRSPGWRSGCARRS